MSITSQLPPIPLAQASANLRALAQAAGQTVEAKVMGQSANGTTQVQIGRQVLNLTLPQSQPVGAVLTLSVQQAEGQIRLTLEAVHLPTASAPTPAQAGGAHMPATNVQLSTAALSGSGGAVAAGSAQGPVMLAPVPAAIVTGAAGAGVAAPPPPGPAMVRPPAMPVATGKDVPASRPVPGSGATMAAIDRPATIGQPAASGGVVADGAVSAGPPHGAPRPVMSANMSAQVQSPSPASTPTVPASPVTAGTATPAAQPLAQGTIMPGSPIQSASAGSAAVPPPPPTGAPFAAPTPRVDIPYAVAAPVVSARPMVAVAGSAATALPPIGQAVSASIVGQHAPAPNYGTGGPVAAGASAAATVPAAVAPTPQAALAQMVQQALPRQDSIVGLTTALTAAAGTFALPEPVMKAAQQVLAARVALDAPGFGGATIKTAIQKSGIFQEAMLASGQGQQASGDVKSALLGLRQSLGAWLGNQAPLAQVASVAPPLRGMQPRARAGDGTLPDLPEDIVETGKLLLERTEAALSRLRLHQHASLPDAAPGRQDAQWSLDLPVTVAGQQHLLQLQIQGEPESEGERPEDRGWQIRFALNLSGAGEVGAQISMRGRTTGVMLWADRPETAAALAAGAEELKAELAGIGLETGAFVVRTGAPMAPPKPAGGPSGQHVDARR